MVSRLDHWFGNSSLAIQFWEIYFLCNEQTARLCDVWDGSVIRLSFRRDFSPRLMNQWEDVRQIISSVVFTSEPDQMIWKMHSTGVYKTQSLYAAINNRGVTPVYSPSVWNIFVRPRVHMFLWLLANNKLLTRDNLSKRQDITDKSCLLCSEVESVHHMSFDCHIMQIMWNDISVLVKNWPVFFWSYCYFMAE